MDRLFNVEDGYPCPRCGIEINHFSECEAQIGDWAGATMCRSCVTETNPRRKKKATHKRVVPFEMMLP